jgi:two-component system CheB/CheR fusion protein
MGSNNGKNTKKPGREKQQGKRRATAALGLKAAGGRLSGRADFPLVGLGASAGGIEALKIFFSSLPSDFEAGFIVVQHLDPDHESRLPRLLQQYTSMKVEEAADGMEVQTGHVYVLPPNKILQLGADRLVLKERSRQSVPFQPIDVFFQSLATGRGRRAIAIVLSGSGSDGIIGLQEVKEAGGMCLVQDPEEAEYDGMPRSAINTGLADFILPVEKMGTELLRYLRHCSFAGAEDSCALETSGSKELQEILVLLGRHLQYDFASYKQGTILRRIERRLSVRHVSNLQAYRRLLEEDPGEMEALARDLLITVTSFFRDPEVFKVLADRVLPDICRDAGPDKPVRIWVPGAATGEEAYSIAMVCFEALEKLGKEHCKLRIFATDADSRALEVARAGIYPATIAEDVSAERLACFFNKHRDGYRVKKALREAVTFSLQNLINDPPFAGLDFISCRNLLIYLTGETQKHILPLLHFALKPSGYLLLGNSEGVGKNTDLFQPIDKKMRLFRKKETPRVRLAGLSGSFALPTRSTRAMKRKGVSIRKMAEKLLIKNFVPCAVVINQQLDVLHYLGNTGFLKIPDGDPTSSLPAMLPALCRNPVRSLLSSMIDGGQNSGSTVLMGNMSSGKGGGRMEIVVRRLLPVEDGDRFYLAVFRELPLPARPPVEVPRESGPCTAHEQMIRQLEEELQFSHLSLEQTIEQLETANEELRVSNEEAMATNEEFLTTNEELEASQEELQSLNEELYTVNAELEEKVASLEQSFGDFDNLLTCGEVGAIFLDRELRIKKLTPAIESLFPQLHFSIGGKLEDLEGSLAGFFSLDDVRRVLQTSQPFEKEIETEDNRWCLLRALPYRTSDNHIGGVIITFTDVTEMKKMELQASRKAGFLTLLTDALPVRMTYVDTEERYRYANDLYFSWLDKPREKVLGFTLQEVLGDEVYGVVRPHIRQALAGKRSRLEAELDYNGAGRRHVLLECAPHFDDDSRVIGAFGVILDITERKKMEKELLELNRNLEQKIEERTSSLEKHMAQLRKLTLELTQTEQRERQQLARVLHDDLQQQLVAAGLRLDRLSAKLRIKVNQEILQEASELLDQASVTARNLASELRPLMLSEANFVEGLRWLADWMWQRFDLAVHLEVKDNFNPSLLPAELAAYLFSVVRELLFNVVKHAQVKSARIRLEIDHRSCLILSVIDQGVGSAPEVFKDLDDNTFLGSGLRGIKERISLIGGELSIRTSSGKGFRVDILLPYPTAGSNRLKCVSESKEFEDPEGLEEVVDQGAPPRKIRVLLADDHRIVREGLRMVLQEEEDFEVVGEAGDGKGVLQLARELRPDVAIMDINMPELNGIAVTRKLKELLPGISVIGLSVQDDAGTALAMKEAGACAYLVKSGPSEELCRAVRSCFAKEEGE